MLRITVAIDGFWTRIALEGRLVGPWVDQLEACWLQQRATHEPGAIWIDLADVAFIDATGKRLLSSFHEQGARLTATNPLARATLEEIKRSG